MPYSSRSPSWLIQTSVLVCSLVCIMCLVDCAGSGIDPVESTGDSASSRAPSDLVVIAFNELGMHCMNEDFADLCILPPFNSLRAQVIRRGDNPDIIRTGAQVTYSFPGNTTSSNKTNFWQYAQALFGAQLPNDTGLTGARLAGNLVATPAGYFEQRGIPITPIMDSGQLDAYPLATVIARYDGITQTTQAVVPVSWEISCNLCHGPKQVSEGQITTNATRLRTDKSLVSYTVSMDILADHDRLHGTNLKNQRPVLCAKCHADPALGTTGVTGVKSMSAAMHTAHASRMAQANLANPCYACHPGVKTNCQRDNHVAKGIVCTNCHGDMVAVGSSNRTPWVDEPKCSSCHHVANHNYEEPGKLFKESRGHGGVFCVTCHNSPHAITPAATPRDNAQTLIYQDHVGTINTCSVCHTRQPSEAFFHKIDD